MTYPDLDMAATARKVLGRLILVAFAIGLAAIRAACLLYRPDLAIKVGTAAVSQTLCDEVFVSGLDVQRVLREEIQPDPGLRLLRKRLRIDVDQRAKRVTVNWAGHFASVAAFHEGYGCSNWDEAGQAKPETAKVSSATVPVAPASGKLAEALDHAFAEPPHPPYREVRAIVVMRNGTIIAERYAPGISPDTPLLSYSVSKSVINALIGILVRQGKLDLYAPAPVKAWTSPSDPRHAITLDELLRMTSGLKLDETDTGFDPVSRMLFTQRDMAAYASGANLKHPPGQVWEYTSGNTLIASSILRDAVGGQSADVLRFAQRELFGPVGMQHVVMEFDGTGTPIGSTRFFASAHDWARFGNLYLNDGIVNGQRILPSGWVAYATKPTLDSEYGSGFWVNVGRAQGMPADAFLASGKNGQRVVVIPSQRLVIVRFGITIDPPNYDIRGLIRLVSDVIAAQ